MRILSQVFVMVIQISALAGPLRDVRDPKEVAALIETLANNDSPTPAEREAQAWLMANSDEVFDALCVVSMSDKCEYLVSEYAIHVMTNVSPAYQKQAVELATKYMETKKFSDMHYPFQALMLMKELGTSECVPVIERFANKSGSKMARADAALALKEIKARSLKPVVNKEASSGIVAPSVPSLGGSEREQASHSWLSAALIIVLLALTTWVVRIVFKKLKP